MRTETPSTSLLELASQLIRTPSPNLPGDERAVADVVAAALRDRGLPAPVVFAKDPGRPNLLCTVDFGPGGRHLVLTGHLDTKPVGHTTWQTDPFEPLIVDDRLYGLGACDMKGAVAAMIEAVAAVARQHPARGRLSLLLTADEENAAEYGARYLAEQEALSADAAVIGEPGGIDADWDQLHLVSRGIANFSFEVEGDQGHSSLSDRRAFVNASVEMARLLVACRDGFRPRAPEHRLQPGGATVNPGVLVSGGVNFGVVPGHAEFSVDVRLLPGMSRPSFEEDLDRFLTQERERNPQLRARVRFEAPPRDWLPATEVPASHLVVEAAREALKAVLDDVPPDAVFPGTTDATWLQGSLGIPTLPALGPGLLERAHRADEFVSLSALAVAPAIYERLAVRFVEAARVDDELGRDERSAPWPP